MSNTHITVEIHKYITALATRYAVRRGIVDEDGQADVISDAMVALCEAELSFTDDGRAKFRTYAHSLVLFALNKRFRVRGYDLIALPDGKGRINTAIHRAQRQLTAELMREPTHQEVADKLNMQLESVTNILAVCSLEYSLYDTCEDGVDDFAFGETEDTEDTYVAATPEADGLQELLEGERKARLMRALATLQPMERQCICDLYGINLASSMYIDPMTQAAIADERTMTEATVSRHLGRVFLKLRTYLTMEESREYGA